MAKKQKAPKAPKAKKEQKPVTPMNAEIKKGLCIGLALILLFASGNFLGGIINPKNIGAEAAESAAETTPAPTTEATSAPTVDPVTTLPPATTAPAASDDSTAPAASDASTSAAADPTPSAGTAPTTKAEIVEYYNTAANKIKTEASKVTRNWEDLQHNEEYLEAPGPLQSIGKSLISTFLKKDETPVDYTGADIIANFPVKTQNYVSNAKDSDVADATCVDEGDAYRITLKFIEATDPTDTGAATAFNIIIPDEVYAAASVVKNFSCKYYDATIECTVDKASGRVTWVNYKLPIVMQVTAQAVVSLDAQVGMTFIDDYSITY